MFFCFVELWVQRTSNRLESLKTFTPYNIAAKKLCFAQSFIRFLI